jgi:hypothetical protein
MSEVTCRCGMYAAGEERCFPLGHKLKRCKPAASPINYPHSEHVEKLYASMTERRLTEAEARTVLNARIFESVIEAWLPELRDVALKTAVGFEADNVQLLISQAATMAQAVAMEMILEQRSSQRVRTAVDADVDRLIKFVKG